jgi:hypothetical protein
MEETGMPSVKRCKRCIGVYADIAWYAWQLTS